MYSANFKSEAYLITIGSKIFVNNLTEKKKREATTTKVGREKLKPQINGSMCKSPLAN